MQDANDDASKAALFRSVREGKVRVLLGSTTKMGEGTNVQTRLVALHHLDAPWRPADIEQREGRIIRQGNQNDYVKIFRYVTEGSFDAYMWQTLETKCRFIAQVMTGDATVRRAEDVDSAALTYAEVKAIASGNPLVIEKATIDAEVMRLTRLKKQHAESLYQMRYRIRRLGDSATITEREIASIREDLRTRTSTRGDNFSMVVKNQSFTDRAKAGRELVFTAAAMRSFQTTNPIGAIGGFPISIQKFDERATLVMHGKNSYHANVSESALGTISSIEHALDELEDRLQSRENDLKQYHRQSEDLAKQLNQPFEHEEKLAAATKRQQEIVTSLDITKNQASARVDEGAEQTADLMEEKPQQNANADSRRDRRRHGVNDCEIALIDVKCSPILEPQKSAKDVVRSKVATTDERSRSARTIAGRCSFFRMASFGCSWSAALRGQSGIAAGAVGWRD